MSRIHDALKRAEEERARGGGQDSSLDAKPPAAASPDLMADPAPSQLQAPNEDKRVGLDVLDLRRRLEGCSRHHWNTDLTSARNVDPRCRALVSEEFRTLRSRLYLMRKVQSLQKLLVTSPLPREGKTFTATNLAEVIAKQPESRLLLIDGDLRAPALHITLGTPSEPGLIQFLEGESDMTSLIQRGPLDNFFFLPAGGVAPNPTELLSNGRMGLLLKWLAPVFDWIIVDSPPVLPVSDAKLLARSCDGVLMLVNAGTTPFDLAQKACGEFPKDQVLGVILNRAEPQHTYGSYYYHSNGDHHKGNGKGL